MQEEEKPKKEKKVPYPSLRKLSRRMDEWEEKRRKKK